MTKKPQADICCPEFNPQGWDGKILEWHDKKFIKGKVFTLFYMPINYGSAMTRLTTQAENAGYKSPDGFCLSECTSLWNTNLYYAVDKEIPGAENVVLSGKYICKVYEGDFSKTGEWFKDFAQFTKDKNLLIEKQYSWYTTCPECAKKYGKNYVVLLGKISTQL